MCAWKPLVRQHFFGIKGYFISQAYKKSWKP